MSDIITQVEKNYENVTKHIENNYYNVTKQIDKNNAIVLVNVAAGNSSLQSQIDEMRNSSPNLQILESLQKTLELNTKINTLEQQLTKMQNIMTENYILKRYTNYMLIHLPTDPAIRTKITKFMESDIGLELGELMHDAILNNKLTTIEEVVKDYIASLHDPQRKTVINFFTEHKEFMTGLIKYMKNEIEYLAKNGQKITLPIF